MGKPCFTSSGEDTPLNSLRRRNEIIMEVRRTGSVSVDELMLSYGVSVETIRRDLRILDEKGIVRRTYGGAVKREQTTWDMPYYDRMQLNLSVRRLSPAKLFSY